MIDLPSVPGPDPLAPESLPDGPEARTDSGRRFYIETYGCQMNIADTESIAGRLTKNRYVPVSSEDEADIIFLNTCSVREHAEDKIFSRLGELARKKRANPRLLIGVAGCMAQRLGAEIVRRAPIVDLVVGTQAYARVVDHVRTARATGQPVVDTLETDYVPEDLEVRRIRPGTLKAFITITRGCDNVCAYCIVPTTRGREASKPADYVVREAAWLAAGGVLEVTLIGQNVNSWEDGSLRFSDLLRRVGDVPGIRRVRFTTSNPQDLTPDVIDAMADCPNVMEHLHLPMQSGSDRTLSRMRREYTAAGYRAIVDHARRLMPSISLTTDIIVGFPGETEDDFEDTVRSLEEIRFDSGFLFAYSPRRGTEAFAWGDEVPVETKKRRLQHVIELQRRITEESSRRFLGGTVEVLLEARAPKGEGELIGKSREHRSVLVPGDESAIGTIRTVRVTRTHGVTLHAEADRIT